MQRLFKYFKKNKEVKEEPIVVPVEPITVSGQVIHAQKTSSHKYRNSTLEEPKKEKKKMAGRGRKPQIYKHLKPRSSFPLPLRKENNYIFGFETKKDELKINTVNVTFGTYAKTPNVRFKLNILNYEGAMLSSTPVTLINVGDCQPMDISITETELGAGKYKLEIVQVEAFAGGEMVALLIDKDSGDKFGINGKGYDGSFIGQIK